MNLNGSATRKEVITPEIATRWLEKNGSNRKLSQPLVEKYARDMRAGNWFFTGEPIVFGASGRLLNGQHRLWACILADAVFETNVTRGILDEDAVMSVMDSGQKRTLANVLQIQGNGDANVLAAIINMCWRYERHRLSQPEWPTHEESLNWYADNPGVSEAPRVARNAYQHLKTQLSPCGGAYFLNACVNAEAAEDFWNTAAHGEGLKQGDPILAYRRWVISRLSARDKPRATTWLAYNLKAMNAWREEKSLRLLTIHANDAMPERWAA